MIEYQKTSPKSNFFISIYYRHAGKKKWRRLYHQKDTCKTVKHGTNSLKIFDDIDTPTNFGQDYYAVTKKP